MRHRVVQHMSPAMRVDVLIPDWGFLRTASLRNRLFPVLLRYTSSFRFPLLLKRLQRRRHHELFGYMARGQRSLSLDARHGTTRRQRDVGAGTTGLTL